ncbi:glycosyltransferase [Candidatus Methylobacter oryzae]|uniref:Cellulose synthase catalytic subunit [UDP-forming] n=1 Tax=Candidatus Methylobacter oryzae TaxID=2497749 RepID=A0ABY3CHP1_9GAMM|nr:glycosyltransferase [Candidatus Methylobacter oryzae]TRX03599.1 glycosyltransferase [Candidatus Methylobacter oryzae]
MLAANPFNKIIKSPVDVIFLSIIFQPIIVKEWLAFKKLFFNDRNQFIGTWIGLAVFISVLLFCHQSQRVKAFHSLKKLFPHINWATPTFADAVRFIIQTLWLATIQTKTACDVFLFNLNRIFRFLNIIKDAVLLPFAGLSKAAKWLLGEIDRLIENYDVKFEPYIYVLFVFLFACIAITIPFDVSAQIAFIFSLWFVAIAAHSIFGYLPKLMLVSLSIIVSSRYLWWRYTSTLNIDSSVDIFFGVILICAETYTWFVLLAGFFQIVWPLQRKPVSLPGDLYFWPSVDVFIPTYREDINIVRTTVLAALSIDWPEDKLNVFILDDGKRSPIQELAEQIGVGYLARDNNLHGKAGNINQALTLTKSEYVAVFDCGHIPARSFLQLTMGWFLRDKNLAIIQTPHHHCYFPDRVERNLGRIKAESSLFYGAVQDDNDIWDASFFSGSGIILKRAPLLEVGGIAPETFTEDAHTALHLYSKGYTSAYINVMQAVELVPNALSTRIAQQARWARGLAQVFRIDNPLLRAGPNMAQRLCYANAMLGFLKGIPSLVFLLAPLVCLYFHIYLIHAPAVEIALYAIPVIALSSIFNSYRQEKRRYSIWSGIYDTIFGWYIAFSAVAALIHPKIGFLSGNIKEDLSSEVEIFDFALPKFCRYLIGLNLAAVILALTRYLLGPADEQSMVLLYLAWVICNLIMLGVAINITQQPKHRQLQNRIEAHDEVIIKKASGHLICALMENYSDSGLGLRIEPRYVTIEKSEKVYVLISRDEREFAFPARITSINEDFVDILFENLTLQQQLDYIQCTYSHSGAWLLWQQSLSQEKLLSNIKTIIMTCFYGYIILARKLPKFITRHFLLLGASFAFIKTLLPKNIKDNSIQHEHA